MMSFGVSRMFCEVSRILQGIVTTEPSAPSMDRSAMEPPSGEDNRGVANSRNPAKRSSVACRKILFEKSRI